MSPYNPPPFLLLILLLIPPIQSTITITANNQTFTGPAAQLFLYNHPNTHFNNITGKLFYYKVQEEVTYDHIDFTEYIIFIERSYANIDLYRIFQLKPIAFIVGSRLIEEPGIISSMFGGTARRDGWRFLAFQYCDPDLEAHEAIQVSVDAGDDVYVEISSVGNENVWEQFNQMYGLVFRMSASLFNGVIFVLCAEKFVLVSWKRKVMWPLNLAQVVLLFELIGRIVKLFYYWIDPILVSGLIDGQISFMVLSLISPITFFTSSLVVVQWNYALSFSDYIKENRVMLYVVFSSLLGLGLFVFPWLIFIVDTTIAFSAISFFYVFLGLLVAVYVFYTLPKVYELLSLSSMSKKSTWMYKTNLILASGIFSVLSVIPLPFIALWRGGVTSWFFLCFTFLFMVDMISLTQILVYTPEKQKKSTTKTKTDNSSKYSAAITVQQEI
eukprot:TRINITY_DN11691_c0_g1_i1.p1 TRINITY_DN11691_c0_g1~~TRINITY_DN11691_c0_g1_i1.p1  ORF type:complete len:452 (+),score=35.27 TRINITY_DN11691_c0_g1_i1:34-1356(+)